MKALKFLIYPPLFGLMIVHIKIKLCKDYANGKGSLYTLAKSIGCDKKSLEVWYSIYRIHGESALRNKKYNSSYTKEFKLFT